MASAVPAERTSLSSSVVITDVTPVGSMFVSCAHRCMLARLMLATGDAVAIVGALAIASALKTPGSSNQFAAVAIVMVPLYLSFAISHGAYDRAALTSPSCGLRRSLISLLLVSLLVLALVFALKLGADYSRVEQSTGIGLAAALIVLGRLTISHLIGLLAPGALFDELLLHDKDAAEAESFRHVLNVTNFGLTPSRDCPNMLDRISRTIGGFDRVVLSVAASSRAAWVESLKGMGVELHVLMPELNPLGILAVDKIEGQLTAVVSKGPLRRADAMLKRAFDLAVVLSLLPGLLMVTMVVALAIKLDDGGPIFFRQTRIGLGNRHFRILKFRSMRATLSDQAGAASTARSDARITRVGHFLRKSSVDELPQLFNVLLGDMSIVGPRPHALGSRAADALFWEVDHRYWNRHTVKPGLTGLAQVRGFRGATETTTDLTNRVQADLEYITGWSIWRDVRILAVTSKVVFHRNAY